MENRLKLGRRKEGRPITRLLKRPRKALKVIVVKEVRSAQIWHIFSRWRPQKSLVAWIM